MSDKKGCWLPLEANPDVSSSEGCIAIQGDLVVDTRAGLTYVAS